MNVTLLYILKLLEIAPPYLYNWNNIESNSNIIISITYLCAGENILGVIDSYGCSYIDTIAVGPINYGCIDLNACNYNVLANFDNGSCVYADSIYDCFNVCLNDIDFDGICDELEIFGCTDENSPSFDINSTEDDGSCIDCDIYIENISSNIDYYQYNSSNNYICDGVISIMTEQQLGHTHFN